MIFRGRIRCRDRLRLRGLGIAILRSKRAMEVVVRVVILRISASRWFLVGVM